MKYAILKLVYSPETDEEKEALRQVSEHAQRYPDCEFCTCQENCLSDCLLIKEDYENRISSVKSEVNSK